MSSQNTQHNLAERLDRLESLVSTLVNNLSTTLVSQAVTEEKVTEDEVNHMDVVESVTVTNVTTETPDGVVSTTLVVEETPAESVMEDDTNVIDVEKETEEFYDDGVKKVPKEDLEDAYSRLLRERELQDELFTLENPIEKAQNQFDSKNTVLNASDSIEFLFIKLRKALVLHDTQLEVMNRLFDQETPDRTRLLTHLNEFATRADDVVNLVNTCVRDVTVQRDKMNECVSAVPSSINTVHLVDGHCLVLKDLVDDGNMVTDLKNYVEALTVLNRLDNRGPFDDLLKYFRERIEPIDKVLRMVVREKLPQVRALARSNCNIWSSEIF